MNTPSNLVGDQPIIREARVTIEVPASLIEKASEKVSDFYKRETGRSYPQWAIRQAIQNVFEERIDTLGEDLGHLLTTPSSDESFLFRRYLDETLDSVQVFDVNRSPAAAMDDTESIFNGFRKFSPERLSEMIAYITQHGRDIYKTKLNKLLFYCDFINYYLHGSSISGSRYVHMPFGPVPAQFESMLTEAADEGRIELVNAGTDAVLLVSGDDRPPAGLTSDEISTLDWVLETFGHFSTSAISETSHREKAYRFTKQGEDIAYAYAKFFEKLPAN